MLELLGLYFVLYETKYTKKPYQNNYYENCCYNIKCQKKREREREIIIIKVILLELNKLIVLTIILEFINIPIQLALFNLNVYRFKIVHE